MECIVPASIDAGLRAAAVLARAEPRDAVRCLLHVAAEYGEHGLVRHGVAVAFRALQLGPEHVDAVALAPALDRLGPSAAVLCREVSDTHVELGRPVLALEILYLQALLEPRSAEPLIRMAALYGQRGLVEATGVCLRTAARRFAADGNNAAQIAALQHALELDASHLEPMRELAGAYWRVGDHDAALRQVAAVL
jgi:hypothetical protein